jgi:hypothetical protein
MAEIAASIGENNSKLVRVSERNFLPKFRIGVLLAAAPDERAKWQPSPAQKILIFLLAISRPIVHSRKN